MSVSDTGRGIYDARQYRCEERRGKGYFSARTGLPERLNGVRAVPENDIFDDEDV